MNKHEKEIGFLSTREIIVHILLLFSHIFFLIFFETKIKINHFLTLNFHKCSSHIEIFHIKCALVLPAMSVMQPSNNITKPKRLKMMKIVSIITAVLIN
jgi:hypothetical protein